MNQPLATINGVGIYDRVSSSTPVNLQLNGLQTMHINGAEKFLSRLVRIRELFPDLFPSQELNMGIRQGLYDQVLRVYNQNQSSVKDYYWKILKRLIVAGQGYSWGAGIYTDGGAGLSINPTLFLETLRPYLLDGSITNDSRDHQRIERTNAFLMREVKQAYNEAGFESNYFGWVNSRNPLIMAKKGTLPLRPDTFEVGSFFGAYPESYNQIIKLLDSNRTVNKWSIDCPNEQERFSSASYLGWKKADLTNAINNSGLRKAVPLKIDPTRTRNVVPYTSTGINRKGKVLGLGGWAYMKPCYYETIYRKIFNTTSYINWPFLCQNKIISYNTLKTVASRDFGIKGVNKLKYEQLCGMIGEIAQTRTDLTQSLAQAANVNAPSIILQPGSPWVNVSTRTQFKEGSKVTDPLERYTQIKDICQSVSTKEELIRYTVNIGIRYLLPRDVPSPEDPNILISGLTQYSKEQICEYLLKYLKDQIKKYGSFELDCQNPNIKKRHILNTVDIMGIQNILPPNYGDLSKGEICQVVSNYVQMLRSTKATQLVNK